MANPVIDLVAAFPLVERAVTEHDAATAPFKAASDYDAWRNAHRKADAAATLALSQLGAVIRDDWQGAAIRFAGVRSTSTGSLISGHRQVHRLRDLLGAAPPEDRVMDLNPFLGWIVGANTVITFATTFYNLMSTRATRALGAIETLKKEVTDLKADIEEDAEKLSTDRETTAGAVNGRFKMVEDRVLQLETDMKHLPEREQVHRIELGLSELNGKFEVISERLKPVQAIADRLQELEFERANGK